jgi:hypothetical protein
MKQCTCCGCPIVIAPTSTVRPMIYPDICYLLLAECVCGSTFAVTMWTSYDETDEEETLHA